LGNVPQVGYHTFGRAWRPIFAEQYFPYPGVRVKADSPSTYPGPFSAINADKAVFIGFCPACSVSPQPPAASPMDIALHGGAVLLRRGQIGRLSRPTAAAFVNTRDGWVTGTLPPSLTVSAIEHTSDGGRSWQIQYTLDG
jgi:hypothetical protein